MRYNFFQKFGAPNDFSDGSLSSDGGSDEDDDSNSDDDIKIMTMEVANEIEMEMDLISNHSNDSAAYRDLDETNDAAGEGQFSRGT